MSQHPESLDQSLANGERCRFKDLLPDVGESPAVGASRKMLRERIARVLNTLSYREREIIKLRYGLGDGYSYTLEEVGAIFQLTRRENPAGRGQRPPQAPTAQPQPGVGRVPGLGLASKTPVTPRRSQRMVPVAAT